jgi:transcription elongation factor SPT6
LLTCVFPQIREGFIVDEDEEEEADGLEEQRRKKKKRRRVEREEEELLDEEDLDLIGENNPEWERKSQPQVRLFARP